MLLQSVFVGTVWECSLMLVCFYLKIEDLPNSPSVLGGRILADQYACYKANSVDFWLMFLENFGLKNEITFSV